MKRDTRNRSDRTTERRRRLNFQKMEDRRLLAADAPLGATPVDTGEFLLGSVAVTPVFFDSDGSIDPKTQNWEAGEIDRLLVKVRQSVDWWSDLLATQTDKHSLSFEIDTTYAEQPVQTGIEPIDRSSNAFERYVGDWLTDLGYGDAPSIERAVHLFNHSQRIKMQTDWAFTIFIIDSSDDDDGFFADGGFVGAFAYPGGLFSVLPSERPVSTYSHEMGHIFWARDEYPGAGSWTDMRGYYNAQNLNAADNPTPGFVQQEGIMRGGAVASRAFDNLVTPASTLAMIGWRDSDGDGVFDLADVPLELDAVGWFDTEESVFSIRGSAAVATLANANSEGTQSDITLARVGALQYKLDDDAWQTVLTPDDTHVEFDLQIPITTPFDQIRWRVIDSSTGVTSDVLIGDALTPLFSGVGGGFAFLDEDGNGTREDGEVLIAGTQFTLRPGDGGNWFYRSVQAADLPEGQVGESDGVRMASRGDNVDGRVAVLPAIDEPLRQVFQTYDTRFSRWRDKWGEKRQLEVVADQTTGSVEIDFVGLDTGSYGLEGGSYARAEVFDAAGNRIDRVTSDLVAPGQHSKLVLEDSRGRIARVVVYGHAETEILVAGVEFGRQTIGNVDPSGTFSVDGLPDGEYAVEIVSPNLTYQFPEPNLRFEIVGGSIEPIEIAAARVDSPRYNAIQPGDVNQDGEVTVRDALTVINDLGRLGNRTLSAQETSGALVDVNNDGTVSAIDALRVINLLERAKGSEGEQPSPGDTETAPEQQANQSPPDDGASSHPVRSDAPLAPAGSPSPAAVDAVFGSAVTLQDEDRQSWNIRVNRKMFNSAGQQGSDQSLPDRLSDREVEAIDPQTDEHAELRERIDASEKFLFPISEIYREFASQPSSDELF
jgi:hypothetical protein